MSQSKEKATKGSQNKQSESKETVLDDSWFKGLNIRVNLWFLGVSLVAVIGLVVVAVYGYSQIEGNIEMLEVQNTDLKAKVAEYAKDSEATFSDLKKSIVILDNRVQELEKKVIEQAGINTNLYYRLERLESISPGY